LNWIVPNKFLAFSTPSVSALDAEGNTNFTPDDYVPILKKFGINLVIRLNKEQYDPEVSLSIQIQFQIILRNLFKKELDTKIYISLMDQPQMKY